MRTSFTISLIVRKGCVAGNRASRSTYENSDPDVLSDPRMLASIALEAQTESYSSARVSTRVSRREFQQPVRPCDPSEILDAEPGEAGDAADAKPEPNNKVIEPAITQVSASDALRRLTSIIMRQRFIAQNCVAIPSSHLSC